MIEAMAIARRPSRLDPVLQAVAWPGYRPQNVALPAIFAAWAARTLGWKAGGFQLAAWGIAPLGAAVKRVVNRPRPITASLPLLGHRGRGPSFPSTHVANYVSTYGFAAWLLARRAPVASAGLVVLIAAIGPSRVRAGDHWASDVLAGYVLGGAYLAILVAAARRAGINDADSASAAAKDAEGAADLPIRAGQDRTFVL
jgi:undecaprenyl-diphosphatase